MLKRLKRIIHSAAVGAAMISISPAFAQDSISFRIGGYMPARCEVEVLSAHETADAIVLAAQRYCNVPHRFVLRLSSDTAIDPSKLSVSVNGRTRFDQLETFTDDRAIIRIDVSSFDEAKRDAIMQGVAVLFET